MLVYVIAALLTYFILFISKKVENKYIKTGLVLVSFTILFLISALRVDVGTDYKSYVSWFNSVTTFPVGFTNFSFNLCIYIIKIFSNEYQLLFIVTSFLILFTIYYTVVSRYDEYDMILFLFIILGYYFSTFNGIRQWIATAIFMYSYKYIINKQFIKFCLCIFIASSFHITAVLLLPCYFLFHFKVKDFYKIFILVGCLIFFKVYDFNNLLATLLKIFSETFYLRYIASGTNLSIGVGSFLPVILNSGMLVYYMIFKNRFKNMENYEENKQLCFLLCFFSILNTTNNLFSRFALYFIPMIIFLLPDFYYFFTKKAKTIFKILIICFGIAFMVINTTLKNSNNPLPYNNVFNVVIK